MVYSLWLHHLSQDTYMAAVIRDRRMAKGELPLPLIYSKLSANAKLVWLILDSYGDTPFPAISRNRERARLRRPKDQPKRLPRRDAEKSDFEMRASLSAGPIRAGIKELVHARCLIIEERAGRPYRYHLTWPEDADWAKSPYSRILDASPTFQAATKAGLKTVGSQGFKGGVHRNAAPPKGAQGQRTPASKAVHQVHSDAAPTIKGLTKSLKETLAGPGSQPGDQPLTHLVPGESAMNAVLRAFKEDFPGQEVPPHILAAIRAEERNSTFMHALAETVPKAKRVVLKSDPKQLGLL